MESKRVKDAVKDIVWMARRYADGRRTYAPTMFNDAYDVLRDELGDFERVNDPDNAEDRIKNFPYATDGDIDFKPRKYTDEPNQPEA